MEPRKNIKEFVDKCHTDFWFYPKRALCFALWVFTIMAVFDSFAMNASAETGTITATNSSYRTYTIGPNAAVVGLFTEIDIDSADYNRIVQIFINTSATNTAFATSGRSTPFTITGCGSGGGLATYSSASKAMAWYFSYPSTVTCSPLVLSYTTSIFDDITTNGNNGGVLALTTAKPVAIGTAGANHILGSNGAAWYYNVTVENDVRNNYVITYSNVGNTQVFETSITKLGVTTVNTKVMIENATGTPLNYSVQGDPFGTYNNINFDVVNVYGQGIALNMTTSTGDYERVVVNTTGSTLPASPTPTPTPPSIPAGKDAAIAFDADTYTVGSTGTLTTNTSFGILDISSYRVDFYSNTNPLINQYAIDKAVTSQHFTVQFPSIGAYTANIVKTTPFIGDEIVATDIASAFTGTGSLVVPITVATGKNFTVNYTFDYQPAANNMCGLGGTGIFAIYQPDGSIQAQLYLLNSNQLVSGTTYSVNMSVPKAGTYILQLRDCNSGVVATSIPFNAVHSTVPPEFNISVSYVNLTTETIYSGDVITGMWGVDNANYSAFPIYYELQNYSTGTILRIPLTGQKGTINQITSGYDLINLMSVTGLIPAGVNKVSLRADTGNSGTEIAFENFTFSTVTATGYDITVDTSCVAPYSPVTIHAITPTGAASSVVVWPTSNTGGFGDIKFNISNTTSIVYVPNTVDVYQVSVLSGTNIEKSTYFTSTHASCVGGVPVNTPTPPPQDSPQAEMRLLRH